MNAKNVGGRNATFFLPGADHPRAPLSWLLSALLLLSGGASHAMASGDRMALDACNVEAFETILQINSHSSEARAVWLSRQLAKWPGIQVQKGTHFRLYYSAAGKLETRIGSQVSGADGALSL